VPKIARVTWIYVLPAWLFMVLAIVFASSFATCALAITRTKIARNELITHNDVAGPILNTVGTVLAVMMSFMVVGVWQEYDVAGQNVQTEASALSDLHHLGDAFPRSDRLLLHAAVDRYITQVISDEWPRMAHGGESVAAHRTAYEIQNIVARFMPRNPAQSAVQQEGLTLANRLLDARRTRIYENETGIPMVLWATMLFAGAVTIGLAFYFRVDRPGAQYVMVIALTAVVTAIFVLTAELDYPFRGDVSIKPQPFMHVYSTLHNLIRQ